MSYQDVITIAAGVVSTGLIAGTEASGADAGKIVIEEGGTLVAGTIREGGALSAVYGAVASNLTAETGAVVEISDGAQTSGLLLAGENTNIAEGTLYYRGTAITGNAVNGILANLNGTYRICIGDGITAADPVLGNSVRIYAQSGSIVSGGNISTNGNIGLLGNASGNGVTVGGEGVTAATYNLFDTATADNTTVDKGGTLAVRAGNIARTVTVNSGGMLTVSEGGVASNVIANPGALFTLAGGSIIGGIFTGNKDHATAPQALTGAFIKGVTLTTDVGYSTPQNCSWLRIGFGVGNRASAADITVERGAKFQINNGYAENTVAITNGGIFVYGYTTDQSLAHHTIVGDGGSAYVFNRAGYNTGSMTDTWIQSGGTGIVGNDAGAGGTMLDTVVNSGGKLTVSSNGVATVDEHPWLTKTNVTVKSGAEVTYERFHNIYYGINDGKTGLVSRWDETTGLAVEAGYSAVVYDGGDLAGATVQSGGLLRMSGGTAATVTLEDGGTLNLRTGATVYDLVADPGARFTISGGSIIGGIFTGNATNYTQPVVNYGGYIEGVTLTTEEGYSSPKNSCWLRIGFGVGNRASAADITVERGAKFQINNGYAENTVAITNGGIIVYCNTAEQSLAHHTIVGDGGSAYVYNRTGYNTASMTDTWIQSGGTGIVGNDAGAGGTMLDTVVNSGGKLTVSSNGVATVDEHPWLTKTNVTVKSGAEVTYGRFHNIYYGINDGKTGLVSRWDETTGLAVEAGYSAVVYSGGILSDTEVLYGGNMFLSSGAVVRGMTAAGDVTMAAYGTQIGEMYGASAYDVTVASGGYVFLDNGCLLSGAVVESGGSVFFQRFGEAWDMTVRNGGQIALRTINIAANAISGTLTLDLAGDTTMTKYMITRNFNAVTAATVVKANGAVGDHDYLLCQSAGAETSDNPFTLDIGGNAYATNAAVTEIVDPFAGLVYSRTRTLTTGTVYDLKLITRVSAHTIAEVDTAAALAAGGADLNIADREARWTTDTAMTSAVNLASGMTTGNAWLELDGVTLTKALYGTAENQSFAGAVNYKVNAGTVVKQLAGGAAKGGSVEAVNLTIAGGEFTNAFYAGGFGDVTGRVKVDVADGSFKTNVFAGALCNYRATGTATSVDSVTLDIAGGAFDKCIYAGAAVLVGDNFGGTAPVHTAGDIAVTLAGGTASSYDFCVYGGGYAAGTYAEGTATAVYTAGDADISVSGGVWGGGARGGRGIFGGVYASGVAASVGNVSITITDGTLRNVYGGGWAQSNGTSVVTGDVEIAISGGSVAHVFGGGSYSSTSGGTTSVAGDVAITISGGTIGGNVYGRGQGEYSTVAGNVTVAFTGDGAYTCGVYGYGVQSTATEQSDSMLDLTEFTGSLAGDIGGFDGIRLGAASAATFGAAADNVDNGEWVFDLAGTAGETPILTWQGGSFAGDEVILNLDGATAPAAGWSIASGLADADAKYTVNIGSRSESLSLGDTILGGAYSGYGFSFEDEILKFSKLA